jgi:hypothetical protein
MDAGTPRWAVWCLTVGTLLLAVAAVLAVVAVKVR